MVAVAGASSGIGAATAKMLSGEGAQLALAARRGEALREVQDGFATGAESLVYPTDVTDRGQAEALLEGAEGDLGPVDALVNGSGVMHYTLMRNVRAEEWDRTVEVNCKGDALGISPASGVSRPFHASAGAARSLCRAIYNSDQTIPSKAPAGTIA